MIRKLDFRGFLGDLDPLGRGIAYRSPPVYKGNAGFIGKFQEIPIRPAFPLDSGR